MNTLVKWMVRLGPLAASLLVGCGRPGIGEAAFVEFNEIAKGQRRIVLEESPVALVGDLRSVLARRDGGLLVLDRVTHRVLSFSGSGDLVSWLGGPGDGPAEFRGPLDMAQLEDGRIVVVDLSKLTILSSDLEYVETIRPQTEDRLISIQRHGSETIVGLMNHRQEGHSFAYIDLAQGSLVRSFALRPAELREVPYWNAVFTSHIAPFANRLVVAHNLMYPLYVYGEDGTLTDSLGAEPTGWIEAAKPQLGEFAGAGPDVLEQWLRTFSQIEDLLVVEPGALFVVHRAYDEGDVDPTYRADLYDADFSKGYENVELPGKPVGGGQCLWLVMAEPPDPWTLECHALTPGAF